jgi:hypothetical protein
VRLEADSLAVALSKEVNPMELFNLKRSVGWNFFGLKEVLKEVLNRPYSPHVFYQPWRMNRIMIGDGRERESK